MEPCPFLFELIYRGLKGDVVESGHGYISRLASVEQSQELRVSDISQRGFQCTDFQEYDAGFTMVKLESQKISIEFYDPIQIVYS